MNSIYQLPQKYTIKIPKNISVIYSENQKIIILIGPLGKKIFKLKTKIFINLSNNKIYITKFPFIKMSINRIKKLKTFQCTFISLLKQSILEITTILYKKLKFVGVGYRAFLFNILPVQILHLRLGYSHQIYFKLDKKLSFFCFKTTTLFIFGNLYQKITEISSKIRFYKSPEIYKGKGILYENEIIILKKGKKV